MMQMKGDEARGSPYPKTGGWNAESLRNKPRTHGNLINHSNVGDS